MYQEIYTTANKLATFPHDGRTPIETLYTAFDQLSSVYGWRRHVITNQVVVEPEHEARTHLPIVAYTSINQGPALWLLSGVHGEEPAGPMAYAKNIELIAQLSRDGIPVVFLPLCHPKGYYLDYRYTQVRRDMRIGRSATEADHLMLHLDDPTRARIDEPATPESFFINNLLISQLANYPPVLELDIHEDEANLVSLDGPLHERYSTYCYIISKLGYQDPIGQHIVSLLSASGIPFQKTGWTRFGEWIEEGIVFAEEGEGSVDEFICTDEYIHNGVIRTKRGALCSIVTETPTIRSVIGPGGEVTPQKIPIFERVSAQSTVVNSLAYLWLLAQRNLI